MQAFKINLDGVTIGQQKFLAETLQSMGAYRIEQGRKLALQGKSHHVWNDQNGRYVYVSESLEVRQGYSQRVFDKNPLTEVSIVDILKSL